MELIGKLETTDEDTQCIFEVTNTTHLFDINLHRSMSYNGKSEDFVQSQYSTLTKQQVRGLYEIYKYDFEAFEYDYKEFFDIAVDGIVPKPLTIQKEAEHARKTKEREEAKKKEKAAEEKRKKDAEEEEKKKTEEVEEKRKQGQLDEEKRKKEAVEEER